MSLDKIKKFFIFVLEISKVIVLALLIVIPIRYFLFQPFVVRGDSMMPNFFSNDYLIVDEISYRFFPPKRGDVIVFKYPKNPSQRFIKRIIGLPGEKVMIKNNRIIIYFPDGKSKILDESEYLSEYQNLNESEPIKLKEDEYYVLGDNRNFSFDSRKWGPLPRKNIIGKVVLRLFPFSALAKIATPSYQ